MSKAEQIKFLVVLREQDTQRTILGKLCNLEEQ